MLIQSWAMNGATDKEIAKKIGISTVTLYDWVNKFPNFANTLKVSKESADAIIERKLFEIAKDGSFPAIKYWLTCRKPDKWNEKVVSEKASAAIYETEDTSETERLIYGE